MLSGVLFGLAAGAFWGLSFLIPKAFTDLPPDVLAISRCGGFAAASLVVLLRRRKFRSLLDHGWSATWLSVFGYSAYYYLLILSVRFAGIPIPSLIVGLIPVTVAIGSRDRVHRKTQFAVSLALLCAGILLLNWKGLQALTDLHADAPNAKLLSGALLATACLLIWTVFSIANGRFLKAHPKIKSGDWAATLGIYSLLTILPLSLLNTALNPSAPVDWNPTLVWHILISVVVLGVGASYIATVFWNTASQSLPVSLCGQLIVSETVFALLYDYIYESRLPTGQEGLCILLLMTGVILGIRSFIARRSAVHPDPAFPPT